MEKLAKTYEFVGELAVALHAKKIKMSFATLNRTLKDNGLEPYKGSRGVASAIRGAHKAWGNLDTNVSSAIANTYVDINGQHLWQKIKFVINKKSTK